MVCYSGESLKIYIKELGFSLQILRRRTSSKAIQSHDSDLGSHVLLLLILSQTVEGKIGKVSLENCGQILEKLGKIKNLLRIDNLDMELDPVPFTSRYQN